MTIRRTKSELAVWSLLALAGGCVTGWIDLSAGAVQAPALILMLVNFALTLPGRAPAPLIAVLSAVGLPLVHATLGHDVNPGLVIVLIPAFIGAYGGRLAGRFLDAGVSELVEVPAAPDVPWYARPLSTRFILAVALVGIAAAGFPSVSSALHATGHRAPTWVALVWQIMTLFGWIAITPLVLQRRARRGQEPPVALAGLQAAVVIKHVVTIGVLTVVHAVLLIALSAVLFIPITPGFRELSLTALTSYLPLDLLAYLAIFALGSASDVERHRRQALQREGALRTAVLDSRLTALRARLNPHFLFNALNSVHVLARAGKPDETSRVVEGLTTLLRYVLDERRAMVPLGEELEFARQYFALQQVRFGTRLQYDIDHDETLNSALVPQLLLQPIVENAVEHGIASSLSGGTVRVSVARDTGTLRLVVEDDGPGTTAAEQSPSNGIGLTSTRERLATLYGDRATLRIGLPDRGAGTRVEITIPFERADGRPAP